MARMPRVELLDVPQHIIQRGNNRQVCFASEEDCAAYCHWMQEYSEKHGVELHAWVLMTNHVHLLCTPRKLKAISLFMQSLGRRYVQYFNSKYRRSGTLWEGRFKSCLVQQERYLLELYRYIELNPVRAAMVEDPAEYHWSSYQINGLGKQSALCTPHTIYTSLAKDKPSRLVRYRSLFKNHVKADLLADIRTTLNKGMALGSSKFKEEVERLTNRRVTEGKRGRPEGWRKLDSKL